jgi:GNAT superfamily N-acetyltransferase
MDAAIELRPARPEDAEAIARLSVQLGYPASAGEIAQRLDELLTMPRDNAVLVLTMAGTLVGWIHVLRARRVELPVYAEIAALVVDADHRNARLGERLVDAARDWAIANALDTLRVRSNTLRVDAHRFYTRLGFTPEKEQLMLKHTMAHPEG